MHLTMLGARGKLDRMEEHNDASADGSRSLRVPIPNPDEQPTITITAAASIAGVAKRTGYAAAKRGEWPVVRTGRSVRVRTRQFLRQCGFEEGQ